MPMHHREQRLAVTTRALPEPINLIDRLPDGDPTATWCWLRSGEGLVGGGSVSSLEVAGPLRFSEAARWWEAVREAADIDDQVGVPGSGLVAFASFSFDPSSGSGSSVNIPALLTGRVGEVCFETTARWVDPSHAEPALPQLAGATARTWPPQPPTRTSWTDGSISRGDWAQVVNAALARIAGGEVEKVVLARQILASLDGADLRWILAELDRRFRDSAWVFSVDGLVGATPEMLVAKRGEAISSRVLAGSLPVPTSAAAGSLATELAGSAKDQAEHRYALDSVVEALSSVADDVTAGQTATLALPNVVHLATDVQATARAGRDALHMAEAVHPSAAVCGTPQASAMQVIEELEHADRGRYAGPVGWMSAAGDADWGLALRCAELLPESDERHRAGVTTWRLSAGGGIVAGSQPDAEVAETDAKFSPMAAALGLDLPRD